MSNKKDFRCIYGSCVGLRLAALALACFLLAPLLSASLAPDKPIRQYHQDLWTTDQGLPQNDILALAQTPDGYLWIATEQGLARFDGLNFVVFDSSNTPALKVSNIGALLVDRSGDLWIGTHGGGMARLHNHEFTSFTTNNGLANDVVNKFQQDAAGDLWIGTGKGLSRWHAGTFTNFTARDGLPNEEISSLAAASDGTLWIGTHNGLSRFQNNSFHSFNVSEGLANSYIKGLFYDHRKTLWIATNGGGLCRFDGDKFSIIDVKSGLASNALSSVYVDKAGTVWIGSYDSGLSRLSDDNTKQNITSYSVKEGLAFNDVRCFFEDHYGDLWVGTGGGGLHRLANRRLFTSYGLREGLSMPVALGVLEDRSGDVWVGTYGGGVNRIHDGYVTSMTEKNGLASNIVFSISQSGDGDIWFGTTKGLNRFHNGLLSVLTVHDGLIDDRILCTFVDNQNALWVGTRLGLSRIENGRIQNFTTSDGLTHNFISNIFQSSDGTMWFGTQGGGLNHFANGKFEPYRTAQGLSNNVVSSIFEDAGHALWIGTLEGGLNRFKDGKFFTITTKNGLPDNSIFSMFADSSGYFWMSSAKGVFRVKQQELNDFADRKTVSLNVVTYGISDGLKSTDCNGMFEPAGWQGHDGRLWIPTMQGVSAVDTDKAGAGDPPPAVFLDTASINGLPVKLDSQIQAQPGSGRLEFRYSAPNFKSPLKTVFKYRLKGFDPGWTDAGNRRLALYTNIPPGDYSFEVIASNGDGSWSPIHSDSFTLGAHFYQTWWFKTLCGLLLACLAALAYLMQARRRDQRERALELRVADRTSALRLEIAERERTQTELVKAKMTAEDATRVKSEFLANMSHEIRTPMNGIVGMTELALATDLTAEQYEYLGMIKYSADSLLTVINDILDFSKVEAGKLDFDPVPFSLRDSLEETIRLVAFRADQKGLDIACDVAPNVPEIIEADPTRLRQIVLNLLSNAVKFTERGEVVLHVEVVEVDGNQNTLKFTVRDTGIGIPEAKLESIFEAFSQADTSTTRRFGGTGLGLAICHQLVKMMNGAIWVESHEGTGSAFQFTIPVAVPPATVSQVLPEMLGISALVVESHQATRNVLRDSLAAWGMQVITVGTLSHAIKALEHTEEAGQTISIAIVGFKLPDGEGTGLLSRMHRLKSSPPAIVMLLQPASKLADAARCRELGLQVLITKPVRNQELREAIRSVLSKQHRATPVLMPARSFETPPDQLHLRNLSILLVEDNPVNQRLSTRLLEKRGHSVQVVSDGPEALAALARQQFDITLMDIEMPGMDGFEVTAIIRQREVVTGKHMAIIASTAHVSKGDEERCLSAGMDGYIPKPIDARLLFLTIDRLTKQISAASA